MYHGANRPAGAGTEDRLAAGVDGLREILHQQKVVVDGDAAVAELLRGLSPVVDCDLGPGLADHQPAGGNGNRPLTARRKECRFPPMASSGPSSPCEDKDFGSSCIASLLWKTHPGSRSNSL